MDSSISRNLGHGFTRDSAAVFAAAVSLWEASKKYETENGVVNFSSCFHGMDQFMREIMRVSELFETWACAHIVFEELDEVWPYLLETKFGDSCLRLILTDGIASLGSDDCLRLALRMRLPIKYREELRIPIRLTVQNPSMDSDFVAFRIQTVRNHIEEDLVEPFTAEDDPFDEQFEPPYVGFYGVNADAHLEHISDRGTYTEIVDLARKLIPGIELIDEKSASSTKLYK